MRREEPERSGGVLGNGQLLSYRLQLPNDVDLSEIFRHMGPNVFVILLHKLLPNIVHFFLFRSISVTL